MGIVEDLESIRILELQKIVVIIIGFLVRNL